MNPLEAATELRANYARWRELGDQLPSWEQLARAKYQEALSGDDDVAAEGAMLAWVEVRQLRQDYDEHAARWRQVAAFVPFVAPDTAGAVTYEYAPGGTGYLGAPPLLWPVGLAAAAAAVTALALAVRDIFRRSNGAERVVDALRRGTVTPAEARALLSALPSGGLGLVGGLALVAGVVALGVVTRGR